MSRKRPFSLFAIVQGLSQLGVGFFLYTCSARDEHSFLAYVSFFCCFAEYLRMLYSLDEKNLKRFRKEAKFKTCLVEHFKGAVRRKMNFTCVLGFAVLRDVVKVFPVSSSSFARKTTGRNQVRSHSGA